MNRRDAIRTLFGAGAGSLLTPALAAQQPDGGFTLRSSATLVLLDVSVRDRDGRFVTGLTRQNFTVAEDGRSRDIAVFDPEDRPATIGILIDQSGSMTVKQDEVRVAARSLIAASNRQDEIFILYFNDRVEPGLPSGVPFSHDVNVLSRALVHGAPRGLTALNDAVIAGLDQLRKGTFEKKTLIIISDGGDNASAHSRPQALLAVQNGAATVYGIGIYDSDSRERDPAFLRKLAGASGGEAYFPNDLSDLEPLCLRIARDVRARYTVGYVPAAGERASTRTIHVTASMPGRGRLTVRTRPQYRYEPESS